MHRLVNALFVNWNGVFDTPSIAGKGLGVKEHNIIELDACGGKFHRYISVLYHAAVDGVHAGHGDKVGEAAHRGHFAHRRRRRVLVEERHLL